MSLFLFSNSRPILPESHQSSGENGAGPEPPTSDVCWRRKGLAIPGSPCPPRKLEPPCGNGSSLSPPQKCVFAQPGLVKWHGWKEEGEGGGGGSNGGGMKLRCMVCGGREHACRHVCLSGPLYDLCTLAVTQTVY